MSEAVVSAGMLYTRLAVAFQLVVWFRLNRSRWFGLAAGRLRSASVQVYQIDPTALHRDEARRVSVISTVWYVSDSCEFCRIRLVSARASAG